MAKGFGGMPGNMQQLIKQAQKMQEDIKRAQQTAEQLVAEGSSGGGAVKVTVNGKNEITALTISPDAVNPQEVDLLQDLVMTAVNDALRKVQDSVRSELSKAAGGMNIPGLF